MSNVQAGLTISWARTRCGHGYSRAPPHEGSAWRARRDGSSPCLTTSTAPRLGQRRWRARVNVAAAQGSGCCRAQGNVAAARRAPSLVRAPRRAQPDDGARKRLWILLQSAKLARGCAMLGWPGLPPPLDELRPSPRPPAKDLSGLPSAGGAGPAEIAAVAADEAAIIAAEASPHAAAAPERRSCQPGPALAALSSVTCNQEPHMSQALRWR